MKRKDGRKSLYDNTWAEPGSVSSKGACRHQVLSWLCLRVLRTSQKAREVSPSRRESPG